jgi:hypothetical protein
MSIPTTLATIKSYLDGIANPGYPGWGNPTTRCMVHPRSRVNIEDSPVIVVAQSWQDGHKITFHADSSKEHDYTLLLYLFVGGDNTDIDELASRLEPWPDIVHDILASHIQLGGNVTILGDATRGIFFPYWIGYYPWGGESRYYGMKAKILVQEFTSLVYTA